MKQQNSPSYQSQDVHFFGNPNQRSGGTTNKDQRLVNCFRETIKGKDNSAGPRQYLIQRGGLSQVIAPPASTTEARGIYYYPLTGGAPGTGIWTAVDNKLYLDGVLKATLSTSTGAVGFVEYAGGVGFLQDLIILDGVSGWIADKTTGVVTQIVDPDFPTPHSVHAAFMDGYLFVNKAGTADIYNCVLDNPSSWLAGDFITAEMFPDNIQAVVRQTNYIVAIGTYTMEYFYNAGNSPGTPLASNKAAAHNIGTPAPDTCCVVEEQIMFVGQTGNGGRTVWAMNGFNPVEIAVEAVRITLDAEGTSINQAKAYCVRASGHRFYVISLASSQRTFVFDFEEKEWHEWQDWSGSAQFPCRYAADYNNGNPIMLADGTVGPTVSPGAVYQMIRGLPTDNNTAMLVSATSARYDFGTLDRKFATRFLLKHDIPDQPGTIDISLYWSDDDYQSWVGPQTIRIDSFAPSAFPVFTQLGSFRRRAWRIAYLSDVTSLRIETGQLDFNMGNR